MQLVHQIKGREAVKRGVAMQHKEFPTLADALVATMRGVSTTLVRKRLGPEFVEQHELILKIPYARKFVLDEKMSAYLCDLGQSIQRGGLRKRITAIENARHQARLPHALTWIEFDSPAYLERGKSEYGLQI